MKTFLTLISLIFVASSLSGCKTLEGATSAVSNLIGNEYYNDFSGKYITQNTLQDYKELNDKYTGKGTQLSYSGKSLSADHVRFNNVIDAPELTTFLQELTDGLISQWPGSPVKAKVQIIDSFAFAPSVDSYGNISIPISTLVNVESTDELAILLSHEISHLLLRHHQRTEVFNKQREKVNFVASSLITANIAKDTKFVKKGDDYSFDYQPTNHGQNNILKTALYSNLINSISDNVWSTAWGRHQEDEADLLGMDLAVSSGYSPRASRDTLERLKSFQGQQSNLLEKFWVKKAEALSKAVDEMDLNMFSKELDSFVSQGVSASIDTVTNFFKNSHMSPIDRDITLRKYARREYKNESRQRVKRKEWNKIVNTNKQLITSYRVAYQINQLIYEEEFEEAEKAAKAMLSSRFSSQPGIREVMYNLRRAQKQERRANKNLELVKGWQFASKSMYSNMINYLMQTRQFNKAIHYIELSEEHLNTLELFSFQKAMAHFELKQKDKGIAALQQCVELTKDEICKSHLQKIVSSV